jgi:hypothetical protein
VRSLVQEKEDPRGLRFQEGAKVIHVACDCPLLVSDSYVQLAAGLAGLGLVQLDEFAARDDIAAGRLVPILQHWQAAPRAVHVVFSPSRQSGELVHAFADWLQDLFGNPAAPDHAAHQPLPQPDYVPHVKPAPVSLEQVWAGFSEPPPPPPARRQSSIQARSAR